MVCFCCEREKKRRRRSLCCVLVFVYVATRLTVLKTSCAIEHRRRQLFKVQTKAIVAIVAIVVHLMCHEAALSISLSCLVHRFK